MLLLARLVVFVVRALGLLLLARFLLSGLGTAARPRPAARPVPPPAPRPEGDLVRDRICNTFLPRGRAVRAVVGGQEDFFCSAACRDRAVAAAATAS